MCSHQRKRLASVFDFSLMSPIFVTLVFSLTSPFCCGLDMDNMAACLALPMVVLSVHLSVRLRPGQPWPAQFAQILQTGSS